MGDPAARPAAPSPPRATWLWGVGAVLLHLSLAQDALHGTDWRWLVLWLDEPGAVHPHHPGYLPLAALLRWLLSPLALDTPTLLRVFSAVGGGIAIAGLHRAAWWWRRDARFAHMAAAMATVTPALLHFATVIELHAPFAAAMAFATVAAVRWLREVGVRRAATTGALTGAATLLHATGHLLAPAIAVGLVWWRRAEGRRWPGGELGLFAAVHGAVWCAGFLALRASGHAPAALAGATAAPGDPVGATNPLDYLLREAADGGLLRQLGPTALSEWIEPFAPWSLVVLAALGVRRLRPAALLLSLLVGGYLLVAVGLVHAITDERGAYLLPLAFPAIVLSLELAPRRAWPVLAAVALTCGLWLRGEPGRLPPDRAFGRAAAAYAASGATVFFVADWPEMDGAHLADARLELRVARKEFADLVAAGLRPDAAQIAGWLQLVAMECRTAGARLVVTRAAVQWLDSRLPGFAAAWQTFAESAAARPLDVATGLDGYVVQ